MDDRIQYKLFNLEVTPPDNAWDNIESVLNNEKANSLIYRFNQYAVNPPSDSWEQIEKELSGKPAQRGWLLSINFKSLAAAAAVIGVIFTASWFYMQGGKKDSISSAAVTALVVPGLNESQKKDFTPSNPNASPAMQVEQIKTAAPVLRISKDKNPTTGDFEIKETTYSSRDLKKYASHEHPIYIKAPAILGKDGHLVIDYQLLVSKDKNYIAVTSPNGQQTRISSKFLPVLSYLAGHASSSIDTYGWKSKIEQWKKRLLEDPDFIPAAGNFLDLPELTDVFNEQ